MLDADVFKLEIFSWRFYLNTCMGLSLRIHAYNIRLEMYEYSQLGVTMDRANFWSFTVAVLLLVCRYSSAQGGCSPAPPGSLISGGPPGAQRSNNVPNILIPNPLSAVAPTTLFRPVVGGHGTDPWAVFSETQVRQHGLWCQVQEANTNNMTDNNIGDWYYPTSSGLLALDIINNDGTPYQELKCDNQVGLVVDGDIINNQGIVRCTTTISGLTSVNDLSTDTNYLGVYEDSVIYTFLNCEWIYMVAVKKKY